MEFQLFMSYVIIGLIWTATTILSAILYFLFPPEIYYWNKVCDKCTTTSAKYRYVIRFIFGTFKPSFQLSKTTVTLEIWDKKRALTALQISPKQLEEFIPNYPNYPLKTVRFLLYRKELLEDISFVVINHDGFGTINVTNVEIQDIKERTANIAYVGLGVAKMAKPKAIIAQKYPSAAREVRSIEPELKATVSLSSLEFIVFFFLVVNLILVLTVYVIPCPKQIFCNDFSAGLLSSIFSGLTASTIAAFVLMITTSFFRYVIKKSLFKEIKCCSLFRYLFLLLTLCLGAFFGIFAAYMAAENRKFPPENNDQFFHELFWMFAVGIALLVFFLFWVSMLSIIGYLIGFFSEPEESKVDFKTFEKTMRTDTELEEEAESSDYMNALMKGNTRVKSISQYGGIASSKDTKQTSKRSASSKTPKKTASVESTGSGYYKQLMKGHGKVKSVSQYTGPGN